MRIKLLAKYIILSSLGYIHFATAANVAFVGAYNGSSSGVGQGYIYGSHGSIALAGDDDYCGADNVIGRRGVTATTSNAITAFQQYQRFIKNEAFDHNGQSYHPYGTSSSVSSGLMLPGLATTTNNVGYTGPLTGGDLDAKPQAYGVYSWASGCGAYTTGNYSTAFGSNATATGAAAQAFGVSALASGTTSLAIGVGAEAGGDSSISLGSVSNARGDNSVAIGMGASSSNDGDVALGSEAKTATVTATTSGIINNKEYTYAGTSPVAALSIGDTGKERQLQNVAAGRISETSTDAVNGSQLFATNSALTQVGNSISQVGNNISQVSNNISDIAVFLGGGATITPNGSFKAPAYQIQGSTRSTLGETLTALDTALTINTQKINMLNDYIIKAPRGRMRQEPMSGMLGITATSGETLADLTSHNSGQGDPLMVDNSKNMNNKEVPVGSGSGGALVDFRGTDGERGLTGIADGAVSATSTDAVNGKQLYETNQKVAQNTTEINKLSSGIKDIEEGKVGLVQQSSNLSEVTIAKNSGGEKITVSGTDGNRQITGVKEGVNDNDAVTVSQLKEVSGSIGDASMLAVNSEKTMKPKATGKNAIALGGNARAEKDNAVAVGADANVTGENSIGIGNKSTVSSKNSVALGSNSVASEDNTVSVGSSLNQRRITNVAPGVNRSDAVTVGQLNESFSSLKQYTDRKVDSLDKKMGDMKTKLTAGIATSMALSG
ncbi:hypothetical protein FPV20_20055, partial [Escherichia coli O177]|uniref:YadA family autotransporter adhesin n=1 Tax=Escherichia coli TaxID=562 RepID=UPI001190145C